MKFNVNTLPYFDHQLKRLIKKFPSLKREFAGLVTKLEQQPTIGTPIGNNCYKIRIAIASKGAGKSGGARLITYIQVVNSTIYLVTIYDKSEQENISDKELKSLIKEIPE